MIQIRTALSLEFRENLLGLVLAIPTKPYNIGAVQF